MKSCLQLLLMGFGLLATIFGVLVAVAGGTAPRGDVGSVVGPVALLFGFAIGAFGLIVGLGGLAWARTPSKHDGPRPR